ncbi:hypothetical protein [Sphingomonas sp. IC081]|uniref:hypothetical protein n=1 Tax=Sphingomonas sp. IC081 TaxID=304378 RepID=UPI00163CD301|nr:hypothetical protein [Sphingomonas sp. IC081]
MRISGMPMIVETTIDSRTAAGTRVESVSAWLAMAMAAPGWRLDAASASAARSPGLGPPSRGFVA